MEVCKEKSFYKQNLYSSIALCQKQLERDLIFSYKEWKLLIQKKALLQEADFVIFGIKRWMDDLQFYVVSNSISVISDRWAIDDKRLCATEARLRLKRDQP